MLCHFLGKISYEHIYGGITEIFRRLFNKLIYLALWSSVCSQNLLHPMKKQWVLCEWLEKKNNYGELDGSQGRGAGGRVFYQIKAIPVAPSDSSLMISMSKVLEPQPGSSDNCRASQRTLPCWAQPACSAGAFSSEWTSHRSQAASFLLWGWLFESELENDEQCDDDTVFIW